MDDWRLGSSLVALAATFVAAAGGNVGTAPVQAAAAPAVVADAVAPLPPRLQGRVVDHLRGGSRAVALTIDCGSNKKGLNSILHTLAERDARATFFVTGQFARSYPNAVRRITAAGYRVGNHSDTHPDFRTLSAGSQRRQLQRAEAALRPLTGRSTRPLFRFPFGSYDAAAVAGVNSLGYAVVGWTVDSLGWQGTSGGQSSRTVYRRVVAAARPGEIVLMHAGENPQDGSTLDADALPRVTRWFARHGYAFASVSEDSL